MFLKCARKIRQRRVGQRGAQVRQRILCRSEKIFPTDAQHKLNKRLYKKQKRADRVAKQSPGGLSGSVADQNSRPPRKLEPACAMIAVIYHYNTQTVRKERQKRVPHPVCRSPEGYALLLAYNIATQPAPAKLKQPFPGDCSHCWDPCSGNSIEQFFPYIPSNSIY